MMKSKAKAGLEIDCFALVFSEDVWVIKNKKHLGYTNCSKGQTSRKSLWMLHREGSYQVENISDCIVHTVYKSSTAAVSEVDFCAFETFSTAVKPPATLSPRFPSSDIRFNTGQHRQYRVTLSCFKPWYSHINSCIFITYLQMWTLCWAGYVSTNVLPNEVDLETFNEQEKSTVHL